MGAGWFYYEVTVRGGVHRDRGTHFSQRNLLAHLTCFWCEVRPAICPRHATV